VVFKVKFTIKINTKKFYSRDYVTLSIEMLRLGLLTPGLLLFTEILICVSLAGLWNQIRIGSVFNWVCGSGSGSVFGIRIQEGKNDPQK
jgi:hypothetical protein